MSPDDISRVQASFQAVKPIAAEAAAIFYDRLFTTAPETRALFKADMPEQGRKLTAALALVVVGLDRMETILPPVSALAKRHVPWGVTPAHYPLVGAALLWTLEQGLGEAWTPELAASWARVYDTLADYMIAEAYGAPQAEAAQ